MHKLLLISVFICYSFYGSSQSNLVVEGKIGIDTDSPSQAIDLGGRYRNIKFGYTHLGETGSGAATILANKARVNTTIKNRVDYSYDGADGVSAIELLYQNGISFFTRPTDANAPTVEGNQFFTPDDRTYERMRITGDGKVGIGTLNPISKLDVITSDDGEIALRGINERTNMGNIGVFGQGYYGVKGMSNSIFVGNIGVWGKSIYAIGTKGESTFGIGVLGESSSDIGVYGDGGDSDFWAENGTYGNSSSQRWKRNIVNISNPLEKLSKLRGVYFDWDEEHGGKHTVGFIAEEVGEVFPEIVFYEPNGVDTKGMDYTKMTPLLVEAANAMRREYQEKFQEQQRCISKQLAEIEYLKDQLGEIDELKQELALLKQMVLAKSESIISH